MTILVDAKYIGAAMRHGRETGRIKKSDAAKIFGVTPREYGRIERGTRLPASNMMQRIMALAFMQLRTRRLTGAKTLSALKPDPDGVIVVPSRK